MKHSVAGCLSEMHDHFKITTYRQNYRQPREQRIGLLGEKVLSRVFVRPLTFEFTCLKRLLAPLISVGV